MITNINKYAESARSKNKHDIDIFILLYYFHRGPRWGETAALELGWTLERFWRAVNRWRLFEINRGGWRLSRRGIYAVNYLCQNGYTVNDDVTSKYGVPIVLSRLLSSVGRYNGF